MPTPATIGNDAESDVDSIESELPAYLEFPSQLHLQAAE
jgi:hypothetical protein